MRLFLFSLLLVGIVGCGTSEYLIKRKKCTEFGSELLHCESKYVEALD